MITILILIQIKTLDITNEKIFRGKISYKKIDKYVDLVRRTIDPDDDMQIEFDIQDDYQHIKIAVFDRVLH